jgi:cytoskeletal protein CcmA (bactofilin family)
LLPDEESEQEDNDTQEQIVNTLDTEEASQDTSTDSEKMKEWLEEFVQNEDTFEEEAMLQGDETLQDDDMLQEEALEEETEQEDSRVNEEEEQIVLDENTTDIKGEEKIMDDNVDLELLEAMNSEEETSEEEEIKDKPAQKLRAASVTADDEVTVISKGTTINGSVSSDGSLEIMGTITGDIECLGKLSITGKISGNSSAAEVYVNTERMEGSITSEGSVKVGLGTVIVGDITATSGVIAGAVKGEIDINGPVVIDSTAIIKGNIKAKSVQINNGAVVEGFCSLSYSAVDVDNIFES